MRALILSISKGSGHQHAAKAIENAFHQNYSAVETLNHNFFELVSHPQVEETVSKIYFRILRNTPKIWGYLYDNQKVFQKTAHIRDSISLKTSIKFKEIVEKTQPSVIICTQALPCEVSAMFKRFYGIDIPLVAVITDFVAHAYWMHPEVDLYIVPTEKTKEGLVKHGIQPSRIKILGIPIHSHFETQYSELEKKAIRKKVGLNDTLPIIMLMGGCQGFAPMSRLVKLIQRCKTPCQIIAVTGLNNKMRRELNQIKSKTKYPMTVYGYVNNIHELMSVSDLLITKPGGMTSSEALVKRLPMVIIHPLPGQEEKNSQFLTQAGAAVRLNHAKEIPGTIDRLLSNRNLLSQLQENMEGLVVHNSAQRIVEEVMGRLTGVEEKEVQLLSVQGDVATAAISL